MHILPMLAGLTGATPSDRAPTPETTRGGFFGDLFHEPQEPPADLASEFGSGHEHSAESETDSKAIDSAEPEGVDIVFGHASHDESDDTAPLDRNSGRHNREASERASLTPPTAPFPLFTGDADRGVATSPRQKPHPVPDRAIPGSTFATDGVAAKSDSHPPARAARESLPVISHRVSVPIEMPPRRSTDSSPQPAREVGNRNPPMAEPKPDGFHPTKTAPHVTAHDKPMLTSPGDLGHFDTLETAPVRADNVPHPARAKTPATDRVAATSAPKPAHPVIPANPPQNNDQTQQVARKGQGAPAPDLGAADGRLAPPAGPIVLPETKQNAIVTRVGKLAETEPKLKVRDVIERPARIAKAMPGPPATQSPEDRFADTKIMPPNAATPTHRTAMPIDHEERANSPVRTAQEPTHRPNIDRTVLPRNARIAVTIPDPQAASKPSVAAAAQAPHQRAVETTALQPKPDAPPVDRPARPAHIPAPVQSNAAQGSLPQASTPRFLAGTAQTSEDAILRPSVVDSSDGMRIRITTRNTAITEKADPAPNPGSERRLVAESTKQTSADRPAQRPDALAKRAFPADTTMAKLAPGDVPTGARRAEGTAPEVAVNRPNPPAPSVGPGPRPLQNVSSARDVPGPNAPLTRLTRQTNVPIRPAVDQVTIAPPNPVAGKSGATEGAPPRMQPSLLQRPIPLAETLPIQGLERRPPLQSSSDVAASPSQGQSPNRLPPTKSDMTPWQAQPDAVPGIGAKNDDHPRNPGSALQPAAAHPSQCAANAVRGDAPLDYSAPPKNSQEPEKGLPGQKGSAFSDGQTRRADTPQRPTTDWGADRKMADGSNHAPSQRPRESVPPVENAPAAQPQSRVMVRPAPEPENPRQHLTPDAHPAESAMAHKNGEMHPVKDGRGPAINSALPSQSLSKPDPMTRRPVKTSVDVGAKNRKEMPEGAPPPPTFRGVENGTNPAKLAHVVTDTQTATPPTTPKRIDRSDRDARRHDQNEPPHATDRGGRRNTPMSRFENAPPPMRPPAQTKPDAPFLDQTTVDAPAFPDPDKAQFDEHSAPSRLCASHGIARDVLSGPMPVARSVAHQIAQAAPQSADGVVEITLDPEELGRLRMSLVPGENGITLTLVAERGETLDLVRRHAGDLVRALEDSGYDEVDLSFGRDDGNQHPGDAPTGANDMTGDSDHSTPSGDTTRLTLAAARHLPADGLDLRL